MPKKLTPEQIKHYEEKGFISPVSVLSPEKALDYRRRLEESEREFGPILKDRRDNKSHLLFRWADELVRESTILDAIEDIIGPDIMIFTLRVWLKEPGSSGFVSWHQDATYHMKDSDSVTAWVSLTNTSVEAGCMEVSPGSHKLGQLEHEESADKNNMLATGHTAIFDSKATPTAFMALTPGQMSMHHSFLVHRSGLNTSNDRRIGIAINCIPTSCQSISPSGVRLTAMLVRGEDRFGHFDHEPRPRTDYDEAARAAHADALGRYAEMKAKSKHLARIRTSA
jgi:ectoine hydroxylase-related dioxygenase (phytanoyl-CoA dioxygenase family)